MLSRKPLWYFEMRDSADNEINFNREIQINAFAYIYAHDVTNEVCKSFTPNFTG